MNSKTPYIVIDGGLAKAENPFRNYHENHPYLPSDKGGKKYADFEVAHPPLPLVSELPVGTRITDWEVVDQFLSLNNVWRNSDDINYHKGDGYETRQALKPIEAPTQAEKGCPFEEYLEPVTPLVKDGGETMHEEVLNGILADHIKTQQSTPEPYSPSGENGSEVIAGDMKTRFEEILIDNNMFIMWSPSALELILKAMQAAYSLSNDRYSKLVGAIEKRISELADVAVIGVLENLLNETE